MCEFCTKHGEGKFWYLTMKNYGQELLAQDGRGAYIDAFVMDFESRVAQSLSRLDAIQALPFVADVVGRVSTARQKRHHFGQVVPLEDVYKIFDMLDSIVRLPCPCRSLTAGRREVRYCYGLGFDPAGLIGQYPDYAEKLEALGREEAKAALQQLDQEGLVHSVWTFETPFIGALCNCDQDCIAYRLQVGTAMTQIFFPAEYVAVTNWDLCSGCRLCRGQCPFGAIRYSASQHKCAIDPALCYGCGLCRVACQNGAIRLEPRQRSFRWRRRSAPPARYKVTVQPCRDARDCHACIDVCPSRVFGMVPRKERSPGILPGDWMVRTMTPSRCSGCGLCVSACPQQAITVD